MDTSRRVLKTNPGKACRPEELESDRAEVAVEVCVCVGGCTRAAQLPREAPRVGQGPEDGDDLEQLLWGTRWRPIRARCRSEPSRPQASSSLRPAAPDRRGGGHRREPHLPQGLAWAWEMEPGRKRGLETWEGGRQGCWGGGRVPLALSASVPAEGQVGAWSQEPPPGA